MILWRWQPLAEKKFSKSSASLEASPILHARQLLRERAACRLSQLPYRSFAPYSLR